MARRPPPIILKHPFMEAIERLSQDRTKVRSLRRRLDRRAPVDELAASLVRNRVCSRAAADMLVRVWAAPGDRWPGSALRQVRSKFKRAADIVWEDRIPLEMWWVMGVRREFFVDVTRTAESVQVIVHTPHPDDPDDFKLAKTAADPGFQRALRRYIAQLEALLP